MKCMLIYSRWSDLGGTRPRMGRPYLDLLLRTLGYNELAVTEINPEAGFDFAELPEDCELLLIQCDGNSRLRRSLLSHFSLSLGLASDDSDDLRVLGARQLRDANGESAGFAVKRRGRMVIFCERPVWSLRQEVIEAIENFQSEEWVDRLGRRPECWQIEGDEGIEEFHRLVESFECSHCTVSRLPEGDCAMLLPAMIADETKAELREQLGTRLYAVEPRPLEELLGELLTERRLTVAPVESCTAGMVCSRLAAVAGSSRYLKFGQVAYSDESKERHLGVGKALLQNYTAVSPEVALAMAWGVQRNADSDLAVAVTGYSGPGDGTEQNPVGTVYFAAVHRNGSKLEARKLFTGTRDRIRYQASQTALHLVRRLALTVG